MRPLEVVVGITDGTMTEISGSGVKAGVQVIVGEEGGRHGRPGREATADGDKTSNPFLPKTAQRQQTATGPMCSSGSHCPWN